MGLNFNRDLDVLNAILVYGFQIVPPVLLIGIDDARTLKWMVYHLRMVTSD